MPTHPPSTAPVRLPDESPQSARIKVVGVGGGGSNAIDRMIDFGVEGVEFIALNTDVQALEVSKAPVRGQLGSLLTYGLSAGSDPNIGRRAAIQDAAEIAEVLEGADMVFITAGLGGGTGTGAAPVIAAIAAEMGALTVAIVTRPFNFEGKRRMAIADWGIDHLLRYVDTLIVIPNEKLLAIAKDAPFFESFKIADDFLRQAVQGISDIITTEGVINRDFADVKTTMAGMGYAVMGTASRSGPTRAVDAVMDAMASPLLEEGAIDGARGILINITGSSSLRLSEVNAASRVIQNVAHEEANIIFGAVLDERLGDEVKATVIATGFRNDGRDRSERRARLLRAAAPERAEPQAVGPELAEPEPLEVKLIQTETVVEASRTEPSKNDAPLAEITPSSQPEAIEVASAETAAINTPAIEPEATQQEPIETIAIEEEPIDRAEFTMEVAEVGALEVAQPEVAQEQVEDAVQDQVEEPVQHEDVHLAIEVYELPNAPIDDSPHEDRIEVEPRPTGLAAMEDTAWSPLVQDEEPLEQEEDWREAIREIARLAEPAFEVEDFEVEENVEASQAESPQRDRLARSPVDSEASRPERYPQATDRRDLAPSPPIEVVASPHLSNTRRAAMAAYAAVSMTETETDADADIETDAEQPPTKSTNAFAEVLEARRRFVENLGRPLPAISAPPETTEPASLPEPSRQEESSRYHWDKPAVEPAVGPTQQRQPRASRPFTIDVAPSQKSPVSHEELPGLSDTPLFMDAATSSTSETNDPGVDQLQKPLPNFNRRLRREGTEQQNGELFEKKWNSDIPVPSFGSILERKS